MTRSRSVLGQEAQFLAALDRLGPPGRPELVEGARAVGLDRVFGNEKLRGDFAIAEAAGDQCENFELACRDAEAQPDAEGGEEDGDQRAVNLEGVFDDHKAVFGVLERGDQQSADETEDEDVALHDRVVTNYNRDAGKQKGRGVRPWGIESWVGHRHRSSRRLRDNSGTSLGNLVARNFEPAELACKLLMDEIPRTILSPAERFRRFAVVVRRRDIRAIRARATMHGKTSGDPAGSDGAAPLQITRRSTGRSTGRSV